MSIRALVLLLLPGLAVAAPVRPVRLVFDRIEQSSACPDEAALRSAIAGRLGFDPFEATAPATVQVSIQGGPGAFQSEITLIDELGVKKSRRLTGTRPDCSDLREALALSLSVALEAFASTPPPSQPAPPTPAPPPEPTPVPVPPSPAPATPKPMPLLLFGPVGAGLALGGAPSPAAALKAGGGFDVGSFSLGIEARFQLPAGLVVAPGRVDVSSVSLELLPCLSFLPQSAFSLRACGLGAGGISWSWATDLDGARTATTPLIALGARFEVGMRLVGWLWISAVAELRGALAQTTLRVGAMPVWTTPPVGGTVGLALSLRSSVTDERRADK